VHHLTIKTSTTR